MGIADATALDNFSASFLLSSGEGEFPSPAGVDMLSVNMKSSRFMASEFSEIEGIWSEVFLSRAIPLGAVKAFCFDCFLLNC